MNAHAHTLKQTMMRLDPQGRDITELHGLHDESDRIITRDEFLWHWLNSLGLAAQGLTPDNLEAIAADTEAFLRTRMELPEKSRSF